jgi:hypothetical protein
MSKKTPTMGRPIPADPTRYEANGATDGVTVLCARCRQPRQFGVECFECVRRGQP